MTSRPRKRPVRTAWLIGAAVLACGVTAGAGAYANPFSFLLNKLRGREPLPVTAVTEARCYGRYLAWRDALDDAIKTTNAWPSAETPVAEYDRMQMSFVQTALDQRGLTIPTSPDVDETTLPADLRAAFDKGVAETKVRIVPAIRQASIATVGAAEMAQTQAAIDTAFEPLRASCAKLLTDHPPHGPTLTLVQSNPPAAATVTYQTASTPTVMDGAPTDPAAWTGPARIQVGVYDRNDDPDALIQTVKVTPTVHVARAKARHPIAIARHVTHIAAHVARAPVKRTTPQPHLTLVSSQRRLDLSAGLRGRMTE